MEIDGPGEFGYLSTPVSLLTMGYWSSMVTFFKMANKYMCSVSARDVLKSICQPHGALTDLLSPLGWSTDLERDFELKEIAYLIENFGEELDVTTTVQQLVELPAPSPRSHRESTKRESIESGPQPMDLTEKNFKENLELSQSEMGQNELDQQRHSQQSSSSGGEMIDQKVEYFWFKYKKPLRKNNRPEDSLAIAESFDRSVFANHEGLNLVYKRLSDYSIAWDCKSEMYAPITAMVNASMTGKSRLITSLHLKGVFVICVCLRKDGHLSYRPRRTPFIWEWASTPCGNLLLYTAQVCALFGALYQELHQWLTNQKPLQGVFRLPRLAKAWSDFLLTETLNDESPLWRRVHERVKAASVIKSHAERTKTKTEATKASEAVDRFRVDEINTKRSDIGTLVKNLIGDEFTSDLEEKLHVLFVIDEARNMQVETEHFSRIVGFRRASRCISYNGPRRIFVNSFALVMDTTSTVADFFPPSLVDGSYRISSATDPKEVFPPLTLTLSLDMWWRVLKNVKYNRGASVATILTYLRQSIDTQYGSQWPPSPCEGGNVELKRLVTLNILKEFEFACIFGRPAFYPAAVFTSKGTEADGVPPLDLDREDDEWKSRVIVLLKTKLLCQHHTENPLAYTNSVYQDEEDLSDLHRAMMEFHFTQTQVMAVLGAIAALEIAAGSHMATELVSGHMRVVSAISKQRRFVYTLEAAEPVLAKAANELIMDRKIPWLLVLMKFRAAVLNSSTSIGYRGEVAMQILCLMAMQEVCRPIKALEFRAFPVFEFIRVLCYKQLERVSKETIETLQLMEKTLRGGYVRMSQFVKVFESFSPQMLPEFFVRNAGICCKELQKAFDIVIPIFFPQNPPAIKKAIKSNEDIANSCHELISSEKATCPFKYSPHTDPSDVDLSTPVALDRMASLVIQVRLRKTPLLPGKKKVLLDSLDSLPALSVNKQLPNIFLCCELGPALLSDGEGPSHSTYVDFVARAQRNSDSSRFVIFSRQLSVRTVGWADAQTRQQVIEEEDRAFRALLEAHVDPSKSENISLEDRKEVLEMHHTSYIKDSTDF